MSDEDDEVVAKPKAAKAKKNPLAPAKAKAKAAATKVIEKAAAKPAKSKAKVADDDEKPAKKRAAKGEGPGKRQPSEEMQEQRTALLALLKRRKNGMTSVEIAKELEWTSAQVAATSFGLVNAGSLSKEKDPTNGRVAFKYAG